LNESPNMPDHDKPQIYLISPPVIELQSFGLLLDQLLGSCDIACFRLALSTTDEAEITHAADHLREICHARDVAIVIDSHYRLVERLGLDGCHLPDSAKLLRDVRKELGADAIVGADCGASRHAGMSAAEAGADYVCFGPLADSGLGSGDVAGADLFQWWTEMIEVPVVASGGLNTELVQELMPITDFFGIGAEIWGADDPLVALKELLAAR
jgi:thiamine-phosphate pyrophosphorylase